MSSLGNIVVVDDEPTNRRYLDAAIGSLGYSVSTHAGTQEALVGIAQSVPDLVLLDWRMPGLSGAEAVTAIKAITDAPVVVCSAFADTPNRERIQESGCDGLLTKPIGVDDLETALKRWLP